MNQIYQIKKFKKELREEEANLLEKRKFREEKLSKRMPRLGNAKWVKPEQDLKLTEELTGTLRELVPEGNVLSDRYNVSTRTKLKRSLKNHHFILVIC